MERYINELSKLEGSNDNDSLLSIAMNLPDSITESESHIADKDIDQLIDQLNETL